MAHKRFKPDVRKEQILDTALILAAAGNYVKVTRDAIAKELGVSSTTIQYHFGTMDKLRRAIMRRAIKNSNAHVVLQGLASNDPVALKASPELKEKARGLLG